MTLPVVWLPEANTKLRAAAERYANIRPEPGLRFAAAVEDTIKAIAETPLRFAVIEKQRRRAGVRRFPYGLFFLVEDAPVVVIACFHGKRHPRYWQLR